MTERKMDIGPMERSLTGALSVPHARAIVRQQFRRKPAVYCFDFLATMLVADASGFVYFAPGMSLLQCVAFVVCGFALYRAGMFLHEIQHMRLREMLGFKILWNVLCGIPLLIPSLLYSNHRDHHSARTYGTVHDGEYLPFATGPVSRVVIYYLLVFLIPPILVIRFLVITPAWLFCPPLRQRAIKHASAISNLGGPIVTRPDGSHGLWLALELSCFVLLAVELTLLVAGVVPWTVVLKAYLVLVLAIELNWMRNFTAHRFGKNDPMSHAEQVQDSVNMVGGGWVTWLLYPVGMRYHALHHLFPSMPYHNMRTAHRLLMDKLPADSAYRATNRQGFLEVAGSLVREATANSRLFSRTL
ncbi:MAG: fatty acid desaturase family protein [Xanthobacteraceae bacterium]